MDIPTPSETTYTIYSKSGCAYCEKAKAALAVNGLEYIEVNCDTYLAEDRQLFLDGMKMLTGKDYRTFPMTFVRGEFLGGYVELRAHLDAEEKVSSAAAHLSFTNAF